MIDSIKPVVYLPIARVAQEVANAEPGVDLSAAEVEVNKNTTKSSSCECFDSIFMSLRTGSHWAAGAGGVARKVLQVLIKHSVYTAVADYTLTFICRHLRVWRWQRRSPLVAGDWRAKSVVTSTALPLGSSLPLLRKPRRGRRCSHFHCLNWNEMLLIGMQTDLLTVCDNSFPVDMVFIFVILCYTFGWLGSLRPSWSLDSSGDFVFLSLSATQAARYCTELWIPLISPEE